jgi:hypothetical protein
MTIIRRISTRNTATVELFFSIADLRMIEGDLPPRAISLVLEWAFLHRDELLTEWELAGKHEPLFWIKPLE